MTGKEERRNWHEVVQVGPRGILVQHEEGHTIYGPVRDMWIDPENFVCICLLWAVDDPACDGGTQTLRALHDELRSVRFPNGHTPFSLEEHSICGPRFRFGGNNLLYVKPPKAFTLADLRKLRDTSPAFTP